MGDKTGAVEIKMGDIVTARDSFSPHDVTLDFWRVVGQTNINDPITIKAGGQFSLESIPACKRIEALGCHLTAWVAKTEISKDAEIEALKAKVQFLQNQIKEIR